MKKNIDNDYKLIPMSEITDEAREIAVRWGDGELGGYVSIQEKHKLASDIMNYARRHHEKLLKIFNEKLFLVSFLGNDERGDIVKGIKVFANSSEEAMDLIKQVNNSREVYSAIEISDYENVCNKNDEEAMLWLELQVGNFVSIDNLMTNIRGLVREYNERRFKE